MISSIQASLVPSDQRVYLSTLVPVAESPEPIEVASNERFSFQVAIRGTLPQPLRVAVSVSAGEWAARVRRVGHVPVEHLNTVRGEPGADVEGADRIPGYVPDPLLEEATLFLPPDETHTFWVTMRPPGEGVGAGEPVVEALISFPDEPSREPIRLRQPVRVHPLRLGEREGFPVTHWFYADALMDWYGTDGFDERFWELARRYITNLTDHGSDMLLVPLFTPPLDGVKRPTQLLRVEAEGEGGYRFDWGDVERYIRLARECGVRYFEWSHLFTQWGVEHAIRVYHGQGRDESALLWPPDTGATSALYHDFLACLLPEFHRFLARHGLLEISFFHLSDEPHEDHRANYRAAREMIRELAPWMKVMDAMTDIGFAADGLIDLPVPLVETAPAFHAAGIDAGCYYCCVPRGRYLNRLMETPLAKIGMHGLLFYRWGFRLFLHWGYNYWYQRRSRHLLDPFTRQDGGSWPNWAYGDPFVVYPGPEGPLDSIRWEVFAESLQDYSLLAAAGVERDDPLLAELVDFADFPKDAAWRRTLRCEVFRRGVR